MSPLRTTASTRSRTTPQSEVVDPAAAWRGVQPSSSAVSVAPAFSSTSKLYSTVWNKKAVLSQGGPRDAAVNFNTFRILQRHPAVYLYHTTDFLLAFEIIFEVFQPVWSAFLSVTDRRTDGQTDGRTTCCGITVEHYAVKTVSIIECSLLANYQVDLHGYCT